MFNHNPIICIGQISVEQDKFVSLGLRNTMNSLAIWQNLPAQPLTCENNEDQGAWGSEGRICFHTRRFPPLGHLRFTAGNGSIFKRVNCNDFVKHICQHHHFVQGKYQDVAAIRKTIPLNYRDYFDKGLKE